MYYFQFPFSGRARILGSSSFLLTVHNLLNLEIVLLPRMLDLKGTSSEAFSSVEKQAQMTQGTRHRTQRILWRISLRSGRQKKWLRMELVCLDFTPYWLWAFTPASFSSPTLTSFVCVPEKMTVPISQSRFKSCVRQVDYQGSINGLRYYFYLSR